MRARFVSGIQGLVSGFLQFLGLFLPRRRPVEQAPGVDEIRRAEQEEEDPYPAATSVDSGGVSSDIESVFEPGEFFEDCLSEEDHATLRERSFIDHAASLERSDIAAAVSPERPGSMVTSTPASPRPLPAPPVSGSSARRVVENRSWNYPFDRELSHLTDHGHAEEIGDGPATSASGAGGVSDHVPAMQEEDSTPLSRPSLVQRMRNLFRTPTPTPSDNMADEAAAGMVLRNRQLPPPTATRPPRRSSLFKRPK